MGGSIEPPCPGDDPWVSQIVLLGCTLVNEHKLKLKGIMSQEWIWTWNQHEPLHSSQDV